MSKSKSHPQDETTRALLKRFCGSIFWLKQVHYLGQELFHDDEAQSLMERTAPAFFLDLNKIVVEYFLLELAKLTDPATTPRGKHENFTVANLIATVEWPTDCLQGLMALNETVMAFREYIEAARNKLLAHYDKATVVSGGLLGNFPDGEDEKVMQALEQMCDEMHKAAFGEIFGSMVPSCSGDVQDLKKVLRRALAFNKLFSDSKGDELLRLSKLIDEV